MKRRPLHGSRNADRRFGRLAGGSRAVLLLLSLSIAMAIPLALLAPPELAIAGEDDQLNRPAWRRAKPRGPWFRTQKKQQQKRSAPAPGPAAEEGGPEAARAPAERATGEADLGLSGERACAHVEALAELGPRVAGTAAAGRAREYLRAQLEAIGAEVRERSLRVERPHAPPVDAVHLIGVLPGDSSDRVVLAASYDSLPSQRGDPPPPAASGAALVLELGRWLALQRQPYTVWLVFADADALPADSDSARPGHLGSAGLASRLSDEAELDRIRVAFFFGEVARPDLAVARDLRSNRSYRDVLWRAALDEGHGQTFPSSSEYASPPGPHEAFLERGMRRVVAITGDASVSPDDRAGCSPRSLRAVGASSGVALQRIQERLAKIDRFVFIGVDANEAAASPPP